MTPVMNLEATAAGEPIFRAPARRTSATDPAERAIAVFERAIAELTSEIEAAVDAYKTLQKESAAESARFEALLGTANDTLREQAATINGLKQKVTELLGSVQTLRSSLKPGMALIAAPLPPPIVIHQTVTHRNEGRRPGD
ncbi:MAG: hypothetical protein NTX49_10190 [Chlamydiae bacterium]|nr:hypothetical protein [Chlamydiota bacterium]